MNTAKSRLVRFVIVLAVSIAMALTPVCAYAAPAQQTATVDAIAVNNAIANKDYNYIISVFFQYYGNYFRQHHLEANFPYFNATEYMKKYPDVAAACSNDPNKALEHYIAHGAAEGRSGCGKYDIVKFLKKYPETVLSTEFLTNINTPEVYFAAIQPKVEEANSSSGTLLSGGGGGGSSSGKGGGYTPAANKKFTMMYYFVSASDLEGESGEMSLALIDTMLALYGADTTNINVLATLGGDGDWKPDYLYEKLGKGTGTAAKTGYFVIDMSEVRTALDSVSSSTKIPVSQMYDVLHNADDDGWPVTKALIDTLFARVITADTVKPIKDTTIAVADMSKMETMQTMLNAAASQYPADNYALSLSGHGGGSMGGVSINVDQLAQALKNCGFNTDSRKLALLSFDSCMMGGVESANLLKDCYEYLYGSETFQISDINYNALAQCIASNVNDPEVAKKLAYTVFTSRSAYKAGGGDLQTAAIFKSNEANDAIVAMNTWAADMITQVGNPDGDRAKKILFAMKKASVYAYQLTGWDTRDENYNYFDAQDYLERLKTELHKQDVGVTECDASIDAAIAAIDKFIVANSYSYDGAYVYNSENGGLIDSSKALWEEYLHYNFCGGNIMLPSYGFLTSVYDEDTAQDRITSVKNSIKAYYTDKYESTGLGAYCNLIYQYINCFVSEKEFVRLASLSEALTKGEGTKYQDIARVEITGDGKAVRVILNKYGDDLSAPVGTSGDAYLDLMDTARTLRAYLTRMVSVKTKTPTGDGAAQAKPYSIVFAEQGIGYTTADGDKDAFTINLQKLLSDTVVNYVVSSSSVATKDDPLDMLLTSSYDEKENKRKLLLGIDSAYTELVNDANTKKAAYDADPTNQTLKEAYEKAEKARADYHDNHYDLDSYQIYAGYCEYMEGDNTYRYNGIVQLVFTKGNGGQYEYSKTVIADAQDDQSINYSVRDGVYGVTFAHYYMDEGNNGTDILNIFEERTDVTYDNREAAPYKGYGEDSYGECKYKYYYYVNNDNTLVIKNTKVSNLDKTGTHNGYFVAINNLDGGHVDLNQKTTDTGDGAKVTHDPASNGDYKGLITIGEAKEPGYTPSTPPSAAPKAAETTEAEETVTTSDTVMLETPITGAPDIIPVQAVIEEKAATDESAATSDNAA